MAEIREENVASVPEIARISIAFEVERILVAQHGEGSPTLAEGQAVSPYPRDYDCTENNPRQWLEDFDLVNWGLLTARDGTELSGSVLIAFDTPGIDMLEGRRDLAVIWDLRVTPKRRGQGIGKRLIRAAEDWARHKACCELKVETQNINFAACRLYEASGFRLREANDGAYPEHPQETQLIWTKTLARTEI